MIDFSNIKKLTIVGIDLTSLAINGVQVWKSYKNWVKFSTESDGKTIYNNGLGYKNGYRVRSGGAEGAMTSAACTGFIPVRGGDVVRIKGWTRYTDPGSAANAINSADSAFNNIGQVGNGDYGIYAPGNVASGYKSSTIVDAANGVSTWVVPPTSAGVEYIRVSAYNTAASLGGKVGEQLIVTINEEIT